MPFNSPSEVFPAFSETSPTKRVGTPAIPQPDQMAAVLFRMGEVVCAANVPLQIFCLIPSLFVCLIISFSCSELDCIFLHAHTDKVQFMLTIVEKRAIDRAEMIAAQTPNTLHTVRKFHMPADDDDDDGSWCSEHRTSTRRPGDKHFMIII